jgi:PAS domain S-box-containing protein
MYLSMFYKLLLTNNHPEKNSNSTFQDSEINHKAEIFFKLVWGSMVIVTIFEIIEWLFLPQNYLRWIFIICSYNFICLCLIYLNRKGNFLIASFLFVIFLLVLIFGLAWSAGGIRSTAIYALPLIVLTAGLLLGWKNGMLIGLIAIMGCLGLVFSEHLGILPVNSVVHNSLSLWVNVTMSIGLLALIQYLTVASLDKTLHEAKNELTLRLNSESRLESIGNNFTAGMIYQVVIKPDGTRKFTYLSDSVKQLYGISPEEGMASTSLIYGKVHEQDFRSLLRTEDDATKTLSTFKTEIRIKNPDGTIRWSSLVSTPTKMDDGSICWDGIEYIITERKNAEEALQKSEKLYRELFNNASLAIFQSSLEGKLLKVNYEFAHVFGFNSPEEVLVLVNNASDLFADPNRRYEIILLQTQHPDLTTFENIYKRKDGTTFTGKLNIRRVVDSDLNLIYFEGFVEDISERKQAEKALRASELHFKELWDATLEGIVIHDKGIIVEVNEAMCNMFGVTREQTIGKSILFFAPPEDQDRVRKHFISESEEPIEVPALHSDGTIIIFEVFARHIIYHDKPMRLVACRDITVRMRAEEALRKSEEKFSKAFRASPEVTAIISMEDGTLIDVNDEFLKITGFQRNEVIGRSTTELNTWLSSDDRRLFVEELGKSGYIREFEVRYRMKNLEIRDFLVSSEIIDIEGLQCSLNFLLDVTEKKIAEKELVNHRDHLEQLVKERTEELEAAIQELHATNDALFSQKEELQEAIDALNTAQKQLIESEKMATLGVISAGIAHEINNPLNFIHGGVLGIEKYINKFNQEHVEKISPFINAINTGVKRASEIVTSLSHYSRHDDLPKTDCDIHFIIDNCLIMLQNQLKNKVDLRKNYSKHNCIVFGTEGKLHQAILNIIANAEQSIKDKGAIDICTKVEDGFALITITDSGCGIEKDNLKKIFDPFFTTKAPGKGFGLGLSITYTIIHEHNGTIEYESKLGKGTKVSIRLPIKQNVKQ